MTSTASTRKKIVVVFPAFYAGGAEAVAVWILQALQEDYDLSLLTYSDLSLETINAYYGSQLDTEKIRVYSPSRHPWISRFLAKHIGLFSLRQHLTMRYIKRHQEEADLWLGAFNEMDFGVPGIQYIHWPLFLKSTFAARARIGHGTSISRRLLQTIYRSLSVAKDTGMLANQSLINSAWTGAHFTELTGQVARVVYPPVVMKAESRSWEERENGFVCISRLVREKKLDRLLQLFSKLKKSFPDLQMHLVAGGEDPNYAHRFRQEIEGLEGFHLHTSLTREALEELLTTNRYGIHVRENEQFGIGIAEMVRAGMLPFVPDSGGQCEIVRKLDSLTFSDEEVAVEKVSRVLQGEVDTASLRQALRECADQFSSEQFQSVIREVCAAFFAGRRREGE